MSDKRLYYSIFVVVITVLTVGIILNLQIKVEDSQIYEQMEDNEEYDFYGDYIGEKPQGEKVIEPVEKELEKSSLEISNNVKKNLIQ